MPWFYDMKKIALVFFLCLATALVHAASYKEIVPAQPTQADGKIEVVEVFWYGCPHCYDFEPYIEKWLEKNPDDVVFRRMPALFRKNWIAHARAFYTAAELGIVEDVHPLLFDALHKERRNLNNARELRQFFVEQGTDGDTFDQVYSSEAVDAKLKQTLLMVRNYKIRGVPAVVVNGKYLTSSGLSGSHENTLKTIDLLINKERRRMQALDAAKAE